MSTVKPVQSVQPMTTSGACLQAAVDALAAGISTWPPRQDGSKAPDFGSWKAAQSARADEATVLGWYRDGRTGVGWVTGHVSGDLEVLDFDDRSTWAEYQKLCREAGLGPLLERVVSGYLEHTPNGAHLAYRCSAVDDNTKLAKVPSTLPDGKPGWKTLIETRGEGGFIIVAPSHGSVNLKGAYTLQSGGVGQIATITPEERRNLFDVACIFDESPRPAVSEPVRTSAAGRPGDDYNARATWADVLEPHGWVRVSARLGVVSWRRPGKDHGLSATTNHADSDLLYVFSTSTAFEANRGYSKFSAFALLNHGGDYSAAAHELSLRGYGVEIPAPDDGVDLSLLLARRGEVQDASSTPADITSLLRVPGLVGELAEWINASSIKLQPVLALGAALAAVSSLLGRKVRTETDLRSNLYVLCVAETGCGKEWARQAIGRLFSELGIGNQLGDSFASDAAVETAVSQSPVRLFLIDEMGYFLGTMRDELAPSHVRSIVPVLLRMYSSSDGVYRKRTYAAVEQGSSKKKKGDVEALYIEQPCLSIYGTTVPSNFYASITKAHISNGLLSRLLVFESNDPDPESRWIDTSRRAVPSSLLDACRAWTTRSINADPEAGNIEARTTPSPLVVKATAGARDVYDDLEATMRRRRAAEREAGRDQGPYTRVVATAMKLALIRACGVHLERPEITEADARWGADLAWGLTDRFLLKVGDAAPENKVEEAGQRVLREIRKAGEISRRDLRRRVRHLTNPQLDDTLKTLIETGDIDLVTQETKGRPKTTYRCIDGTNVFGRNKVDLEAQQDRAS